MFLVFPKLKKTVWFFSAFGITMLFCSLIMKHYFENYVTVIAAACISLITIPIHTYKKRKSNFRLIREYRSFRYGKNDTAVEKFKIGLARTHFKAEVIASAIWCRWHIKKPDRSSTKAAAPTIGRLGIRP